MLETGQRISSGIEKETDAEWADLAKRIKWPMDLGKSCVIIYGDLHFVMLTVRKIAFGCGSRETIQIVR